MSLPAYTQTSRYRGCGYASAPQVRREYRQAAAKMHKAYDLLVELYAAGRDITAARESYDALRAAFWRWDHNARRYAWFYGSAGRMQSTRTRISV